VAAITDAFVDVLYVSIESCLAGERLLTDAALVVFGFFMHIFDVTLKMMLPFDRLGTQRTFKFSFLVRQHVLLQDLLLREGPLADEALLRFVHRSGSGHFSRQIWLIGYYQVKPKEHC